MTPQEQQLLQGLTDRINQTQLSDKDPEAEQYLGQTLGRNPDALYILAQTVLVQQYALDQARQQIDQLKQQLDQAKLDLDHARQVAQQPVKHTSFLGSLLGTDEPAPPPPPQSREPQYAPVNYNPAPPSYPPQQFGQPQYAQPQYAQPGFAPAAGGGFLRSALQTATGVAAGALAFEGIESLLHGFGSHAGYGGDSGFGNFGSGGGEREEVVNNYYGDASPQHPQGLSSDLEDRRDDSSNSSNDFADTNADNSDDSSNSDDDSSDDSSSYDDSSDVSSSGDDGGSDDSF